jgi:hypothetical protein
VNTGRAHGPAVLLVGEQEPVSYVERYEPVDARDAGFAVVFADRLDDGDPPADACHLACVGCVVQEWPDVQTAVKIARRHGAARLDGRGRWHPA